MISLAFKTYAHVVAAMHDTFRTLLQGEDIGDCGEIVTARYTTISEPYPHVILEGLIKRRRKRPETRSWCHVSVQLSCKDVHTVLYCRSLLLAGVGGVAALPANAEQP